MMQMKVYVSPERRRPFNEWFQRLNRAAGLKTSRAIRQMENGYFSDSRSVGGGVMERRIHSGPGYRIYHGRVGHTMVLLLGGGIKQSQKADIQRALAYWQEFKTR